MHTDKTTMYFIIGMVIFTVLVLFGGVALTGNSSSSTLSENPQASIKVLDESSYDWGEIDINGGKVEKVFKVKNNGVGALELTNFETSCMCTEVEVVIDGQASPAFGMHTESRWVGSIAEGETAEIRVVFDPLFHGPQGTGPITRTVNFETNDSENNIVELMLTGVVI